MGMTSRSRLNLLSKDNITKDTNTINQLSKSSDYDFGDTMISMINKFKEMLAQVVSKA